MKDFPQQSVGIDAEIAERTREARLSIERDKLRREAQGLAVGYLFMGMQEAQRSRVFGTLIAVIPGLLILAAGVVAARALGLL